MSEHKIVTSKDICKKPPRMDFVKAHQYLKDVKNALDKFEIPFFLFYGTLIGAIREHDFMVHDNDIDVGILAKNINRDKVSKVARELQLLGYRVNFGSMLTILNMCNVYRTDVKGLKVDGYFLFDFQDKLWFPRYAYIGKTPFCHAIPYEKKYFENMKPIKFKGDDYLVPTPPEEFLEKLWGKWWIATGGQWGIIKAVNFEPNEFKPKDAI